MSPTTLPAFSLVRDDVVFRLMRAIGLIPREGLGLVRRAMFFSLLAWLPIAVWAVVQQRAFPGTFPDEPLLAHFGIHARGLVAIPLLILAQGFAHRVTTFLMPWFLRSHIVPAEQTGELERAVRDILRKRDAIGPWIAIVAATVGWAVLSNLISQRYGIAWGNEPGAFATSETFGGFWFLWVMRTIYVGLIIAWLWRLVLLASLFRRIARLDLAIVPTHPDRAGGLGFVERFTGLWMPVVFAVSVLLSAHWVHLVLYHDAELPTFYAPAAAFLVTALVVFLGPFAFFTRVLLRAKRVALLEYGALVGDQGRLTRRRWILGERLDDPPLLDAPEIGPVADAISLFDAVRQMRLIPIGRPALAAIIIPAILPMLAVVAAKLPIAQIFQMLMHAIA